MARKNSTPVREKKAAGETNPRRLVVTPTIPSLTDDGHTTEDHIRELAYFKWMQAGRPVGDGVSFWLDAEREVLA